MLNFMLCISLSCIDIDNIYIYIYIYIIYIVTIYDMRSDFVNLKYLFFIPFQQLKRSVAACKCLHRCQNCLPCARCRARWSPRCDPCPHRIAADLYSMSWLTPCHSMPCSYSAHTRAWLPLDAWIPPCVDSIGAWCTR